MKESTDYYYAHDLAGLPLLNASHKQQNFSKHVHEEYCIGVIDQGALRFFHNGAEHVAPQHELGHLLAPLPTVPLPGRDGG